MLSGGKGLDPLMTYDPAGIGKTGLNVLAFQPRITLKNLFHRITRRQHPQNMLYSKTAASNDRFPTENLGVHSNATQKPDFIHELNTSPFGTTTQS